MLRVVTVAGDAQGESRLAEEIGRDPGLELVLRCLDRSELLAAIRGASIDVIAFVGAPAWLDAQTISEAGAHEVRMVGIARDPLEAETLRRLQVTLLPPGAGASALSAPVMDEGAPSGPLERGDLIAVWGPKGAPGRTTVAVELAFEIAGYDGRTLLVDADTYGGDISQMLAVVDEVPTIVWAANAAAHDRLDEASLFSSLRRVGDQGPVFLAGIHRSELWADISAYGWDRLLDVLSSVFPFTVIDAGFGIELDERVQHDRDRLTRRTIAQADHVVAVCRADPVGIKTFLWSMQQMKELRSLEDVIVVANRVASGEADEVRYILCKHLGKRPIVMVPDAPAETRRAVAAGLSIREKKSDAVIVTRIRELSAALGIGRPRSRLLTRVGDSR